MYAAMFFDKDGVAIAAVTIEASSWRQARQRAGEWADSKLGGEAWFLRYSVHAMEIDAHIPGVVRPQIRAR